jgi:hypothetical protein
MNTADHLDQREIREGLPVDGSAAGFNPVGTAEVVVCGE